MANTSLSFLNLILIAVKLMWDIAGINNCSNLNLVLMSGGSVYADSRGTHNTRSSSAGETTQRVRDPLKLRAFCKL
jgi:hypothetical protein